LAAHIESREKDGKKAGSANVRSKLRALKRLWDTQRHSLEGQPEFTMLSDAVDFYYRRAKVTNPKLTKKGSGHFAGDSVQKTICSRSAQSLLRSARRTSRSTGRYLCKVYRSRTVEQEDNELVRM
jgi:hypothetical protein